MEPVPERAMAKLAIEAGRDPSTIQRAIAAPTAGATITPVR
jgi:hypothetical protein